mgnify:CR=1 FL=1
MSSTSPDPSGGWADRLERLARFIPGLGRYQDREGLREVDRQVRTLMAHELVGLCRVLEGAQQQLADLHRLEALPALDRINRRLATLADRIRFASYGFAGLFDLHKIRETELAALHRFDLALLEQVPLLRDALQQLAAAAREGEDLAERLAATEQAVDRVEGAMEERDRLARGL